MAEKKTEKIAALDPVQAAIDRQNETVPIKLFKDNGKYKDDVFVQMGDKSFQIQRGITVNVPRYVADIIRQSEKQDQNTATMIQKLTDDYERKAENL